MLQEVKIIRMHNKTDIFCISITGIFFFLFHMKMFSLLKNLLLGSIVSNVSCFRDIGL